VTERTVEALDRILSDGNPAACIDFFREASVGDRRKLAPHALERWKEDGRFKNPEERSAFIRCEMLKLLVLATASLGQLKKMSFQQPAPKRDFTSHGVAILRDRQVDWLPTWVDTLLEEGVEHWCFVHALVQSGLCPRPEQKPDYIMQLIRAFDQYGEKGKRIGRLRDRLLDHPEVLEDLIWSFFELEEAGNRLSWHDAYAGPSGLMVEARSGRDGHPEHRWDHTLVALSREGRIPRARLLDASLDAMGHDTLRSSGWYAQFHGLLQPTVAERVERIDRYLRLVDLRQASALEVAYDALDALLKAGKLPVDRVAERVGGLVPARPKSTVKRFLKLLDAGAGQQPAAKRAVARAAADALQHESPEVHDAAIGMIERLGDRGDKELARRLSELLPLVAASQRTRLETWLGLRSTGANTPVSDEFVARAERLERAFSELAGVPEALAAVRGGTPAPGLQRLGDPRIPRLDPDRQVRPIESLDELIDTFLRVLEGTVDLEEADRVLDGVSRFCAEHPPDFGSRTASLRKRASDLLSQKDAFDQMPLPFSGRVAVADFCALALMWIDRADFSVENGPVSLTELVPTDWWQLDFSGYRALGRFHSRRLFEIGKRAREGRSTPLLAMPTHGGCWIDPRACVRRMKRHGPTSHYDFVQALLRLAPDGRSDALKEAAALDGEQGDALRYALGGEVEIGTTAAYWIAAARSRAPYDDDPRVEARHPGLGPNAGLAARFSVRVEHGALRLERTPPMPSRTADDLPTVLMLASHCDGWDAAVWPAAADSFFVLQAKRLPMVMESVGTFWQGDWRTLLDPDAPLGPVSRAMIALGMSLRNPAIARLAQDALIAALDDGRLDGPSLAEMLTTFIAHGKLKPARWLKALTECARVSPLHAQAVRVAVDGVIPALPADSRVLPAALEMLLELCIESGQPAMACRPTLEGPTGSGRTARLAHRLLAVQAGPTAAEAASERTLKNRVERAERWQSRARASAGTVVPGGVAVRQTGTST